MGFENQTKILQILRDTLNSIEICSAADQEDSSVDTFSMEYLFNAVLLKKPTSLDINLNNISVLQLSHCNLTDLPKSCCNLNLQKLDLSHNKLSEVPTCLYIGLKRLEVLNLSHNMIRSFYFQPECVANIRIVKLNNNNFSSLPKWVLTFRCTNLEELNFSTNQAVHYSYLKNSYNLNIIRLKKLKLRNCHLIQKDCAFLKSFKPLKYLDISNKNDKFINKFYEVDDLFVKPKWRHLQVLKMNNLSLAFFPEGIAWLESLIELHLKDNCISWLPDGIQFMVNLVILDVSNNDLVSITEKISNLVGLEILKAPCNYISTLPDFSLMPALRVLDLYDNSIESMSFNQETIQEMDLENNYLNTEEFEGCNYQTKREKIRKGTRNSSMRTNGPKSRRDSYSLSSTHTSSIYSDSENELTDNIIVSGSVDDEEDWDLPRKEVARNPDLDTEDDEWTGSEEIDIPQTRSITEKVYIDDEDWMFVDANEEEYI